MLLFYENNLRATGKISGNNFRVQGVKYDMSSNKGKSLSVKSLGVGGFQLIPAHITSSFQVFIFIIPFIELLMVRKSSNRPGFRTGPHELFNPPTTELTRSDTRFYALAYSSCDIIIYEIFRDYYFCVHHAPMIRLTSTYRCEDF